MLIGWYVFVFAAASSAVYIMLSLGKPRPDQFQLSRLHKGIISGVLGLVFLYLFIKAAVVH